MTTNRPLRVFLCHSSADKPAVRELYQKLRAEPWIEPWLDEEELFPGMDWNLEIEKAIEATDVILVCLSNNSITKEGYVQREVRIALDYAGYKPEGTLFIIPVRLDECEPPRRLRMWQYADYFLGQQERGLKRLLISLEKRANNLNLGNKESGYKEDIYFKKETIENLTRKHQLIQEIQKTNRYKNPSGKEGFEIVVLEKNGVDGFRYYSSLKPGETLKIAERMFSDYILLQVDLHLQTFYISDIFRVKEQNEQIELEINVLYRVYDARLVVMSYPDPLAELKQAVLVAIGKELKIYSRKEINSSIIEGLVKIVKIPPRLGLTIERIDVLSLLWGNTPQNQEDDGLEYHRIKRGRLLDLTVFLQEYPDLTSQILSSFSSKEMQLINSEMAIVKKRIEEYVEKRKEIDGKIDINEVREILKSIIDKDAT